jgi:hypothetical protein
MQLILLQTYFFTFLLLGDGAKGEFGLGRGDAEMGDRLGFEGWFVGGKLEG